MHLDCLVYFALTTLIPLKLTYSALKEPKTEDKMALWSNYWAFFVFLGLLQCLLPFLSYQPIKLILLLLHIWLYAEDYRGALFLSSLLKKKVQEFGLQQHIHKLAQVTHIAKIFDLTQETSEGSPQNPKKD